MAPSRARHGISPADVHSARRRDRPHRADRRMGLAAGLHRRRQMAGRISKSRSTFRRYSSASRHLVQMVLAALAASGLSAGRLELEITEIGPAARQCGDARDAAPAAVAWRAHRHGRFRHRLFHPELSAQLPLRQDQDRSLLRQRPVDDNAGSLAILRAVTHLGRASAWRPRRKASRRRSRWTGYGPKAARRCRASFSARHDRSTRSSGCSCSRRNAQRARPSLEQREGSAFAFMPSAYGLWNFCLAPNWIARSIP